MNMEEREAFYRRGGGSPKGGVRQPLGENLLLFMVVTPHQQDVTPHLILHDIHTN
jgi:hypothetical protein